MKEENGITVPVQVDIDEGIVKLEKAKKLLEDIKVSAQEVKELFNYKEVKIELGNNLDKKIQSSIQKRIKDCE